MKSIIFGLFLVSLATTTAFAPSRSLRPTAKASVVSSASLSQQRNTAFSLNAAPQELVEVNDALAKSSPRTSFTSLAAASMVAFSIPFLPIEPAQAAEIFNTNAISSAFVAYGHYLGLVLMTASLTVERLVIKAGMTQEAEDKMAIADIVYGIAATLVLVTGYFRATQYGKGWEFYAHEPIFWVKLLLFSIVGASSLFPTIKIIQRAVAANAIKEGKEAPSTLKPMSEKLAARLTKIINGELLALGSIPLAASLMSRGVGYAEGLPWHAGAAPAALAAVGLGIKYVKEAVSWEEEDI